MRKSSNCHYDLDLIVPNVQSYHSVKRFNEKSGNILSTFIIGLGLETVASLKSF